MYCRLLKRPGRKAGKKKPKTNSVSAIKASDQPDNLNPTTSNETITTNHRTDSISDEVTGTASSSITQYNAPVSSTEVMPNNKEVVAISTEIIASINETVSNENTMSIYVPLVTGNSKVMVTANSSSSTSEELLNNDALSNTPAEMSMEVELVHDDNCSNDSHGRTMSVSEGEIVSENEKGNPIVTGSCDSHHDTDASVDHTLSSHQPAISNVPSDQSQHQDGHSQHHDGQRNHSDQSSHYSGRPPVMSRTHNHPISKDKSNVRSVSKPHKGIM